MSEIDCTKVDIKDIHTVSNVELDQEDKVLVWYDDVHKLVEQLKDLKDGISSILGRRLHQQSMVVELAQLLKGGKG